MTNLSLKNKIGYFLILMMVLGVAYSYVQGIRGNYEDHAAGVSEDRGAHEHCTSPWGYEHLSFAEVAGTFVAGVLSFVVVTGTFVWLLEPEKVVVPKAVVVDNTTALLDRCDGA
jgi:hypothetical protein